MAYTPGPGKAQFLNADGVIIKRAGFEITTPEYDVVANIPNGAPIRKEEDAQLIAAAPDLLAACEALMDEDRLRELRGVFQRYSGEPALALLEIVFPELFAAIAKATGGDA
jgi:hypothetical protein